jgi:hypothetical protein
MAARGVAERVRPDRGVRSLGAHRPLAVQSLGRGEEPAGAGGRFGQRSALSDPRRARCLSRRPGARAASRSGAPRGRARARRTLRHPARRRMAGGGPAASSRARDVGSGSRWRAVSTRGGGAAFASPARNAPAPRCARTRVRLRRGAPFSRASISRSGSGGRPAHGGERRRQDHAPPSTMRHPRAASARSSPTALRGSAFLLQSPKISSYRDQSPKTSRSARKRRRRRVLALAEVDWIPRATRNDRHRH